jgi:hypothetical protein
LDRNRGHRHRAQQTVTTKGGPVELSVSPLLQFRQRISDAADEQRDWAPLLRSRKDALQPLYDYVKDQSSALALYLDETKWKGAAFPRAYNRQRRRRGARPRSS